MGKRKGKKGDASNGTIVTTVATAGGLMLLRKVLAAVSTKVTGKVPPTDLTDPKVTLPEALVWAVATGVIVETVRFAIVRTTMRRPLPGRTRKLADPITGPAGALPAGTARSSGALPADQLAVPLFGELAPVMHKETAGAGELVCLPRDHAEREFLVRQVRAGQFKGLGVPAGRVAGAFEWSP